MQNYFYPRPPGGGRPSKRTAPPDAPNFYPRPPGGGRLKLFRDARNEIIYFYPRPPGGGRPLKSFQKASIFPFLSTPSGWRATDVAIDDRHCARISIHALRVEGDVKNMRRNTKTMYISIHALRVEGDCICPLSICVAINFYPRPPGGGRPHKRYVPVSAVKISIHALRVEGDTD